MFNLFKRNKVENPHIYGNISEKQLEEIKEILRKKAVMKINVEQILEAHLEIQAEEDSWWDKIKGEFKVTHEILNINEDTREITGKNE